MSTNSLEARMKFKEFRTPVVGETVYSLTKNIVGIVESVFHHQTEMWSMTIWYIRWPNSEVLDFYSAGDFYVNGCLRIVDDKSDWENEIEFT